MDYNLIDLFEKYKKELIPKDDSNKIKRRRSPYYSIRYESNPQQLLADIGAYLAERMILGVSKEDLESEIKTLLQIAAKKRREYSPEESSIEESRELRLLAEHPTVVYILYSKNLENEITRKQDMQRFEEMGPISPGEKIDFHLALDSLGSD